MTTISEAMDEFVGKTYRSRATKTAQVYELGVNRFAKALRDHRKNPSSVEVSELKERWISWLYESTANLKPTSEDLYATAVRQFYKYVSLTDQAEINLAKLAEIMRDNRRGNGHRQARVDLDKLKLIVDEVAASEPATVGELRDRALIYTLATTGLRLHEALELTIDDVDFERRQTTLVGKGDREDTVFWSPQTLRFIKDYLDARNAPVNDPLFVAHSDPRTISHEHMHVNGARNAVQRATGFGPHSFRHYAVSMYLKQSQDIKATQRFARHASAQTTLDSYAHLLEDEVKDLHSQVFD